MKNSKMNTLKTNFIRPKSSDNSYTGLISPIRVLQIHSDYGIVSNVKRFL
jgi:hypothetical protein